MEQVKDENYYQNLDKRTKEYKEWKAKREAESEGLGDTLEKVFEATGVADVVKFIAGEDCGCAERKQKLNTLFRFGRPECLKEDEYVFLADFYAEPKNTIQGEDKVRLIKIYNRVFRTNKKITSCGPCLRSTYNQLKEYFDNYN